MEQQSIQRSSTEFDFSSLSETGQKMAALLIIGISLFYDIDMKNYILEK